MANNFPLEHYLFDPRITIEANWRKPIRWNSTAADHPLISHVCFLACEVMDKTMPKLLRERLFDLIRRTPHLRWQILTKELKSFRQCLPWMMDNSIPYTNVWIGVIVEKRSEALRRIAVLREIPASRRILCAHPSQDLGALNLTGIDTVFCEGSRGTDLSPMQSQWAKHLHEQCAWQNVPFFMKSSGKSPLKRDELYQIFKAKQGLSHLFG